MENNHHQEMTKEELQQIRGELRAELKQNLANFEQKLAQTEARIVRWVVGLFLGHAVLLSTIIGTYAMFLFNKIQ